MQANIVRYFTTAILIMAGTFNAQATNCLWLPLNENTGVDVYDSSGLENDGVIVNDAAWVDGRCRYGLQFNTGSVTQ